MKKPEPADFGLSGDEAESIAGRVFLLKSRLVPLSMATSLAIGIWCFGELADWQLPTTFSGWFEALVVVFVATIVVGFLPGSLLVMVGGEWVYGRFHPEIGRYAAYTEALRLYQSWVLRTTQEFWTGLRGIAFEAELAALFRAQGYVASLTARSGDQGIDIVLSRDGAITLVQCKATRSPVGPAIAREFYGAIIAAGAPHGILASVAGFSPAVREFVRGKPIDLLDLNGILRMQFELGLLPQSNRLAS